MVCVLAFAARGDNVFVESFIETFGRPDSRCGIVSVCVSIPFEYSNGFADFFKISGAKASHKWSQC